MNRPIVYEYRTDSENMVTRIAKWSKIKKPDYDNNPPPPEGMETELRDEYGRLQWQFKDNVLTKLDLGEPEDAVKAKREFKKMPLRRIVKLLIRGILDKEDVKFLKLVERMDLLEDE